MGAQSPPVLRIGFFEGLNSDTEEADISTRDQLIKARLGMLALAEELQNISLARKRAVISRSHVSAAL